MALKLIDPDEPFTVTDVSLGVGDGDTDTSYTLRPLTRDVWREIKKRHTTRVRNKRTGALDTEIDWEAFNDDLLDHVVIGWSGVVLSHGEPAPCTRDLKLRGLDSARCAALLDVAGLNRVEAAEADAGDSFRRAGGVRDVVGG